MLQSHLQILHSMILIIYILTPFTMTSTLNLFQSFRIIQTRMMVLAVIHGLRPNQKLKSILEGCTDLTHLWESTLMAHNLFSKPFFQSQSVYLRFTHIMNMQPHILHWVRDASHPRPRIQSLQKVLSTHQRSTSPSRIGPPLLERQRQSVCLGPHPNLY